MSLFCSQLMIKLLFNRLTEQRNNMEKSTFACRPELFRIDFNLNHYEFRREKNQHLSNYLYACAFFFDPEHEFVPNEIARKGNNAK